jgi:hypothetical protein
MEVWPQNRGCVAAHCAGMYRVGSLFDKLAHLFVDLPAKSHFSGIPADISFTPQISFADSSNSQSVMPEYIRPRNIQNPDRGVITYRDLVTMQK